MIFYLDALFVCRMRVCLIHMYIFIYVIRDTYVYMHLRVLMCGCNADGGTSSEEEFEMRAHPVVLPASLDFVNSNVGEVLKVWEDANVTITETKVS